ncbi:substrate-binding domain-containing protein [Profundibacter sp.]|uniref:substrate-binding domain-containing protein n=1 Tax=Profundibacter sp. TaxID=3101071 RepID=UPI003D104D34
MPFAIRLATIALAVFAATTATARDQVQVAGSNTVLPYAAIVAEAFGESFDFPTPVVESGGSSAGLKKFCEGVGERTIDIANASRRIKDKEIARCHENGVTEIIEVRIGYDGIVFASAIDGNDFAFAPADLFNALSDKVLVDGKMVANPNTNWSQVNADLPDQPIQTFIPGTKHGTREVFEDKVILAGCEATGAYDVLKEAADGDKKAAEKACIALRTDGLAVDIDGDYTETLARISSNKDGIGVFGLAFYENYTDKLRLATISGILPSTETIASGEYPVSRPLYFYVKKAHIGVIPSLKEYAEFFVSDEAAGPEGPLADYGLVSDPKLSETQRIIADEVTMK